MLDIVHRLYENYDESYCKEKYLKSKSELLEMINSAMSDTDLKEELVMWYIFYLILYLGI